MTLFADYSNFLGALALWREARGATGPEILAVWWAILNRLADPARFPLRRDRAKFTGRSERLAAILLEPWQFSSFNRSDPNAVKFPQPGTGPAAQASADWQAFERCCNAVESPGVADPTGGATHYHSYKQSERDLYPSWALDANITLRTAQFTFYRL